MDMSALSVKTLREIGSMNPRPSIRRLGLSLYRAPRHLLHFFRHSSFFSQWRHQIDTFRQYLAVYGGARQFLRSPYLHISVALTVVTLIFWPLKDGIAIGSASEIAISVLPNLLGFTVGALAIVLAFSSAAIFKFIAQDGKPDSFFMSLTANLVHFILVQVVALTVGIIGKSLASRAVDDIALFLLFYAVLVVLSAAVQLFHTAVIYNMHASLPEPTPHVSEEGPDGHV